MRHGYKFFIMALALMACEAEPAADADPEFGWDPVPAGELTQALSSYGFAKPTLSYAVTWKVPTIYIKTVPYAQDHCPGAVHTTSATSSWGSGSGSQCSGSGCSTLSSLKYLSIGSLPKTAMSVDLKTGSLTDHAADATYLLELKPSTDPAYYEGSIQRVDDLEYTEEFAAWTDEESGDPVVGYRGTFGGSMPLGLRLGWLKGDGSTKADPCVRL
jgi:hypothetical protein